MSKGSSFENYAGLVHASLVIIPLTLALRASNNMLSTTVPLLAYSFRFTKAMVGALSALMTMATLVSGGLANVKLGPIARRRVFLVSSVVYAVIYPLFTVADPIALWALSAVAGFVFGLLMPNVITSASLLPRREDAERMINMYTLALSTSLILGPMLEALILKYEPLRESFLYFEVFPLAALAISPFVKFPPIHAESNSAPGVRVIVANGGFIAALLNITAYNIVFSYIIAFGGIFAQETFRATYSEVEILFTLFFTTSFLGRLYLSIRPAERLWPYMALSMAVSVMGLVMAYTSSDMAMYALALLMLGLPHGLTYPLSLVAISRSFDYRLRNAANSIFYSISGISSILTPIIMGYVSGFMGLRASFILLIPPILAVSIMLPHYAKAVDKAVAKTALNP